MSNLNSNLSNNNPPFIDPYAIDWSCHVQSSIRAEGEGQQQQTDQQTQQTDQQTQQPSTTQQTQTSPLDDAITRTLGESAPLDTTQAGGLGTTQAGGLGQQQQPALTPEQVAAAAAAAKPKPGDLVGADGRVLARAGAERRLYENGVKITRENVQLKQALEQVNTRLQAFTEANGAAQQLGLSPQESTFGLQILAAYKKNPVETLKWMLTEAKAAGHNVDTLGGGSAIDTAALGRLIDQRLQPFTQHAETQRVNAEAMSTAEQVWGDFAATNPEAGVHEQALVNLMTDQPNLTLGEAFLTLKLFSAQNGYDFNQPLAPQIIAKRGAGGQQQQQPTSGNRVMSPVPLNGGNVNGGIVQRNQPAAAFQSENMSNRDLVAATLRAHGINV